MGLPFKKTIVRPSNVTAYTAGDVIGIADPTTPANAGSAVHLFSSISPGTGWFAYITDTSLTIMLAAVPAGMTSFTLHLYDGAPDPILDNAAWVNTSANDARKYLGSLSLGTPVDIGGVLFVKQEGLTTGIQAPADGKDIYGELVTVGGYTPTSAEEFIIRLGGVGTG